jgi:hypothetical protein
MLDIAILSMASAAVSFTISEAMIAQRLRKMWPALLGCGYCLGFWVSLALVLLTGAELLGSTLIAWLVTAWISGFQWAAMKAITEGW